MLPQEQTIKNGRMLCKVITGRTSPTPMTSINKVLSRFHERYQIVVSRITKKTAFDPAGAILEVRDGQGGVVGGGRYTHTLSFPCSKHSLMAALLNLDQQAEGYFRLQYGQRQ